MNKLAIFALLAIAATATANPYTVRRLSWWDDVAGAVGGAVNSALETVGGVVMSSFQSLWQDLSKDANQALTDATTQIAGLPSHLRSYAEPRLQTMQALLQDTGNTLGEHAQAEFERVAGLLQTEAQNLVHQATDHGEAAMQTAIHTMEAHVNDLVAGARFRPQSQRRLGMFDDAWNSFTGYVSSAWDTVRGMYANQITNSFDQIETSAHNLVSSAKGHLETKMAEFRPMFQDILSKQSEAAQDYVATHLPAVQQHLQELASNVGVAAENQLRAAVDAINTELHEIDNVTRRARLL